MGLDVGTTRSLQGLQAIDSICHSPDTGSCFASFGVVWSRNPELFVGRPLKGHGIVHVALRDASLGETDLPQPEPRRKHASDCCGSPEKASRELPWNRLGEGNHKSNLKQEGSLS